MRLTGPMGTTGGWRSALVAALLGTALVACSGSSDTGSSPTPTTSEVNPGPSTTDAKADEDAADATRVPGASWEVVDPADADMDAEVLDRAKAYAFDEGRHTQGVVVVRHGRIVSEWYAPGTDEDSWTASWSVAKSFATAAVGIAVADGKIPRVDEPMATYLPSWKGTDKDAITLRNVLQMQSGLDWDEGYDPAAADTSDVVQMGLSPDELAYAVARPVTAEPGTRWLYSSGDAMLLSAVIAGATGTSAAEYAERELFDPIGMERADWWQDVPGHTLGYCCLDATARAYARFGLLYLHEGRWGDEQIIPASWVADSIADAPGDHPGYGYMWWLGDVDGVPKDMYAAEGHDGQYIWVIPSLDLVVVRTGTYVKDPGPSVADPNLFAKYPPDDLVPGKGTIAPDTWDDAAFLGPIVASVSN